MRSFTALGLVLALHATVHADVVGELGGEGKIIGRGALLVMDVGDQTRHDLRVVDRARGRVLELADYDYFGTRTARVRRFFDTDLIEVVVIGHEASSGWHRERHLLVSNGKTLDLVCEFEGDDSEGRRVSVRKVEGRPLVFDVDTRAADKPPTRQRYLVPSDPTLSCDDPQDVAVLSAAEERRVDQAVRARGYHDVRILAAAPGGAYLVHGARGKGDKQAQELLWVTAKSALVVLGAGGTISRNQTRALTSAQPFLDRKDLTDVVIDSSWSNGFGGSATTTHFLVRDPPSLACTFEAEGSSGMEDQHSSFTTTIAKISDEPLRFTLTRQERSTRPLHGGYGDGPRVQTCEVPSTGSCRCAQSYGIGNLGGLGDLGKGQAAPRR